MEERGSDEKKVLRPQRPLKTRISHQVKLLGAFVLMCLIFSVLSSNFLTASNLLNVLRQASTLFMLACGQTLVLLIAGIDLSQGSVLGLVSVVTALGLIHFGLFGGILAGLLVGSLCGLLSGVVISKAKVPAFVVTLGMLFIAEGITLIITDGQPVFGFPPEVASRFFFIGGGLIGNIPVPVILFVLALFFFHKHLRLTTFGRHIYAIGGNEEAAHLSGIQVDRRKILVYTVNGFLVAVGSLILTSRVNSGQPLLGGGYLMESIGAVVIGGTSLFGGRGGVLHTSLGVCFIAFMVNGLNLLGISTFIKETLIGVLMIVAVLFSVQRGR
jgi:ribose transport system permease protein